MMAKIALKTVTAVSLVLCSATLASAQGQHRHHYAQHVYAQHNYAYSPAQAYRDPAPGARAYQAYSGYSGGPSPNVFSYDPLIPLKQEVPPPVDPNEPASGSYGAMLQGRNPAAGT
jgi:hypothetical protein